MSANEASQAALAQAPAQEPVWHLGFDCATKTFAFSLSRVDLGAYRRGAAGVRSRTRAALEVLRRASACGNPAEAWRLVREVAPAIEADAAETCSYIHLADGETADLLPGRADDSISTVERVRAVARYVAERIRPALRRLVPEREPLRVVVEFQMGANAPSRTVASALVALFVDAEELIIVGPALKNKIATCEAGRYCHFAAKYSTTYGANKAHAKYNFEHIERVFGSGIPATATPALRGHIADSFMQVLGLLVHGPDKNAETYY